MSTASHEHPDDARRSGASLPVRITDLEPYVGLTYLSKLFRLMAVVVVLLLISEVVSGLMIEGLGAAPVLLGEVSRLVVLAGLLWGAGDLALLLIDIGHDIRAVRVLLARGGPAGPS